MQVLGLQNAVDKLWNIWICAYLYMYKGLFLCKICSFNDIVEIPSFDATVKKKKKKREREI